jgi:hypothetical protein
VVDYRFSSGKPSIRIDFVKDNLQQAINQLGAASQSLRGALDVADAVEAIIVLELIRKTVQTKTAAKTLADAVQSKSQP